MALANLFGWSKMATEKPTAACGSACGASDKPGEKRTDPPVVRFEKCALDFSDKIRQRRLTYESLFFFPMAHHR